MMNKRIGPIGAFLMVLVAPMAHGALVLSYSINNNPSGPVINVNCTPVPIANPNPSVSCPSAAGPPLDIVLLGANSNSPGTPINAQEASATVEILNNSAFTQTITINVASNGFLTPTTPPGINFLSHIGGTVVVGSAANLLTFQSCGDLTNSLTGCPGTNQAPLQTPSITATGSFDNSTTGTIASLSAPYALDELITLTLGAGAEVNFSASTTLNSTPEPMSVALLGGILVLTGGIMRRKRKQASQA
jgi:hypothetical protein